MHTWYLLETTVAGQVAAGPFTFEQLASMARSGRLTASSRVARAGTQAWIAANEDPELRPLVASAGWQMPGMSSTPSTARRATELSPLPPYSFVNSFTLGWEAFTRNWGALVLVTLAFIGCQIVLSIPTFIMQAMIAGGSRGRSFDDLAAPAICVGCCGGILSIAFGLPLQAGFAFAGVQAARGRAQVSDLFIGFKRWGAVVSTGLLTVVCTVGIILVCCLPLIIGGGISAGVEEPWPAAIGLVCSLPIVIVAALFFSVFLTIPVILVADPRVHARWGPGALSIAWELGKRTSPSFFLLALCIGIVCQLSILACIIGIVLFGIPLYVATIGAAYALLTEPFIQKGADPRRAEAQVM